ncbi:hypothetical protein [Streptomyces sp. NPDC058045]|uniref:hypothetical protein n=1 Tax=Streptomyces sp. NPDC058045 TaxID=3346311 RepID=UPI0036E5FC59
MSAEIEHGTLRGWRQHNRRKDPPCEPCLEAKRADNAAQHPATSGQQAWNKGRVGAAVAASTVPVIERCTVDGCGAPATTPRPDGMVRVHAHGSTEPARWYCPGRCRAIGQALAELRTITRKAVVA